jgi:hypothetical protein
MHPTIQHGLMTARVADRHRHTGRGQLADAASRARQLPRQPGTYPVIGHIAGVLARCMPSVSGTRQPRTAR